MFLLFELKVLHFYFALCPANYVAAPATTVPAKAVEDELENDWFKTRASQLCAEFLSGHRSLPGNLSISFHSKMMTYIFYRSQGHILFPSVFSPYMNYFACGVFSF